MRTFVCKGFDIFTPEVFSLTNQLDRFHASYHQKQTPETLSPNALRQLLNHGFN